MLDELCQESNSSLYGFPGSSVIFVNCQQSSLKFFFFLKFILSPHSFPLLSWEVLFWEPLRYLHLNVMVVLSKQNKQHTHLHGKGDLDVQCLLLATENKLPPSKQTLRNLLTWALIWILAPKQRTACAGLLLASLSGDGSQPKELLEKLWNQNWNVHGGWVVFFFHWY